MIDKERERKGNKPKWIFKERNCADTYLDLQKCHSFLIKLDLLKHARFTVLS